MEQIMQMVNTYVIPMVTYLATSGILTAILVALCKRKLNRAEEKNAQAEGDLNASILAAVKTALKSLSGAAIDFDITGVVDAELKRMTADQQKQNAVILDNMNALKDLTVDCALALSQARSLKTEDKEHMLANISKLQSVRQEVKPVNKITVAVKPETSAEVKADAGQAFEVL